MRCSPTPTRRSEVHLLSNGRYHVVRDQRRRRLQPLARPGRDALARGRHVRRLGHASATCADVATRRSLVNAWQPTLQPGRQATRRSSAGAGRVPPPRRPDRDAHRDQRLARGRHRAAPRHADQPLRGTPRPSRSPATRRSCWRTQPPDAAPSGVQQPVRADRTGPRPAGHPLHAPSALARRSRRPG